MAYQGNIPVNQTIYWLFVTQFSGLPTTLSGSPVLSVYKDDNTTETTTGPTLVADFDGRAGLNSVKIATTDAFYVAGHDYTVVITTGTVGGVSAVGYVVGTFSIDNRISTEEAAIKTVTDKFAFGVSNQVDANVKSWLQQTVAAAVNGIPKVDLFYVLGTILTEGAAGRLVGGIVKFFNIATPAATMDHGVLVDTATTVTNPVTTTYQIKKNTALANFEFPMFDSTNHNPATGLTVTGQVSLDGGAFGSLTNSVSAVANGVYKVSLAAADVNGNVITLRFTATGADDQLITFVTQT